MTKADKTAINNSLDELLGDQTTYWDLWEKADDRDDVAEVFGSVWNDADAIVEIYSPPRVVERAAARGLTLSKKPEKHQVRQELHRRKPRLLITSPPCTKFSPLQHLRLDQAALQEELGRAIEHMNYSMQLQEDQLQRGDHGPMNTRIHPAHGSFQVWSNTFSTMRSYL